MTCWASINRNVRGIEVNDDTLSVDVIRDVCLEWSRPLSRPSTRRSSLMQKEYIYPRLGNRMSPKEWNEAGKPDIVERAAARKREILSTYYPDYLPRAIDDVIRARHDIKLPREVMETGDPRWIK